MPRVVFQDKKWKEMYTATLDWLYTKFEEMVEETTGKLTIL